MPRLIQNTLQPLYEMKKILGINNVATDDLRLDPGFVRVAENVDIDTELMARRRIGILRQVVSGNAHSGWSDGDKLCFMVLNDNLVQLNMDWTTTNILTGVGSSAMHFYKLDDRVFFSNLTRVGYIQNGAAHGFPETDREDRQRMYGGELIEYVPPRLYVAQGGFIIRSIAGDPFEMDLKRDDIYLGGPITMLIGVNGPGTEPGLYVSGGGKCVYLSNFEPDLENAHYKPILDIPALPGSAIAVERMDLGRGDGAVGRCCIWSTSRGVFMGLPGGRVKDLTSKYYQIGDIEGGSAFIKDRPGYRQYVFMARAPAGMGLINLDAIDSSESASITL